MAGVEEVLGSSLVLLSSGTSLVRLIALDDEGVACTLLEDEGVGSGDVVAPSGLEASLLA